MTVRIFHCRNCGHKMRYGAKNCGYSHVRAPIRNRSVVPFTVVFVFLVVLLGVFAVRAVLTA
jgi:hypothetical protein